MGVSLCCPYWERQAAADRSIARLNELYDLDMEIVVADDGSPNPFVAPESRIPIRVITLPRKEEVKDPCVPVNASVNGSIGDIVILSNPELWHVEPVLPQMLEDLERRGERGVVMASVWCPEDKLWHVHPSIGGRVIEGVAMPPWENSLFLAAMHRPLWEKSGGIDEDYRDGWGYADHDYVLRLSKLDPDVVVRPDLVVEHSRNGAKADWTAEMLERNRRVFVSKWA